LFVIVEVFPYVSDQPPEDFLLVLCQILGSSVRFLVVERREDVTFVHVLELVPRFHTGEMVDRQRYRIVQRNLQNVCNYEFQVLVEARELAHDRDGVELVLKTIAVGVAVNRRHYLVLHLVFFTQGMVGGLVLD